MIRRIIRGRNCEAGLWKTNCVVLAGDSVYYHHATQDSNKIITQDNNRITDSNLFYLKEGN